jgi:hypothetical protein
MLKDEIKKITKNNSSKPELACQTRDKVHETRITL